MEVRVTVAELRTGLCLLSFGSPVLWKFLFLFIAAAIYVADSFLRPRGDGRLLGVIPTVRGQVEWVTHWSVLPELAVPAGYPFFVLCCDVTGVWWRLGPNQFCHVLKHVHALKQVFARHPKARILFFVFSIKAEILELPNFATFLCCTGIIAFLPSCGFLKNV